MTKPLQKATLSHNKELSSIFHQMASAYRYLGPAQRFRATAYETASRTLSNMQEPVDVYSDDIKSLEELKGVGESIAEKIIEYIETGKIEKFEKLQKEVPHELIELMDISGFGPATVKLLHDKLNIQSKEDLVSAIEKGKLKEIKGFGAKKIENMRQILKMNKDESKRMSLADAEKIGNKILAEIKKIPGIIKVILAGSLRRKSETIGDIDIVATALKKDRKKIIKKFVSLPDVGRIIGAGETRASILLKKNNVQVDLRVVDEQEYGAALFYFTGSKEHNLKLRLIAKNKGWKINEYGVFDTKTNKRLAGETEESIYDLFGFKYIPPEQRLGKDEYEIAKKKNS